MFNSLETSLSNKGHKGTIHFIRQAGQRLTMLTSSPSSIHNLHWNIAMTAKGRQCAGKLSKPDLRVLSLDRRVAWQLPEHSAANIVAKTKTKRKASTGKRSKARSKRPRNSESFFSSSCSSSCTSVVPVRCEVVMRWSYRAAILPRQIFAFAESRLLRACSVSNKKICLV